MKSIILFVLIFFLLPLPVYAQAKRDCKVTFKISGERNDGRGNHETEMDVTQRCYDFDKAGLQKQLKDDQWRYGEHNYQFISNPTMKQDCAGYTFQKIFNKGTYWITSQEFYDKLLLFYGKQIRSLVDPFGWGDVRAGDVLVYRKGGGVNHITYVSEVNTTLGTVTSVVIETKDGKEGVFKHKIGLMNDQTDPLIRGMGEIWVYRLDPDKLQITEHESTCDCDQKNISGPGWVLESFIIDPDKKSGKWSESHQVIITGNSVVATVYNSKLNLTITSPPKFIKDGEEAKFEVTTSYEGEDDNVHLNFSFNCQEAFEEDYKAHYKTSVYPYGVTVGKITMNKFQKNTNKGIYWARKNTAPLNQSTTGIIQPSFSISPYNFYTRMFEAKYRRRK